MFWVVIFSSFGALLAYFIFFFPLLQVQTIQVSGNQTVPTDAIKQLAWQQSHPKILGIPFASIFMANTRTISKDLLATFPDAQNAQVSVRWPNALNITITERSPVVASCDAQGQCFFVDSTGVAYQSTSSVPDGMVVVQPQAGTNVALGSTVIASSLLDSIVSIRDALRDNFQIGVRSATVGDTLVVTTSEGWQVYFDPTVDITLQITKLNVLLQKQISEQDRKKLTYIYLQYQDKAYYK